MAANNDEGGNAHDEARIRRRRNIALALVLGGLVVLFFLMTIVRMGGQLGQ